MAKPYSQDLRDRVIDAVKRGEMSRRAAARRYEISESVAIKWLERIERYGSREPAGHGGHRASRLWRTGTFFKAARAEKSDVTLQVLCDRLSAERGQSRHLDDEPLLSPDRRHGQKKTRVAREQDRPDISRHRKRWRTY
jgi:transposase